RAHRIDVFIPCVTHEPSDEIDRKGRLLKCHRSSSFRDSSYLLVNTALRLFGHRSLVYAAVERYALQKPYAFEVCCEHCTSSELVLAVVARTDGASSQDWKPRQIVCCDPGHAQSAP